MKQRKVKTRKQIAKRISLDADGLARLLAGQTATTGTFTTTKVVIYAPKKGKK